jgi:hypothetical protein
MGFSLRHLHHFNPWAILVSALILWMLGAVWYSPALFSKPWMAALNIVPDPSKKKSIVAGMISSFLGDLLLSFALLHVILWSGAATGFAGAFVAFVCWLGFFAATQFPQGVYEGRPTRLFWINSGYWLLGLTLVGALMAVWQ